MSPLDRRSRRQRENADPIARYLGELQAEVMQVFWSRDSATVREVVESMNARREKPLAYTTLLTLTTRLWTRGLLTRAPDGRGFRYRASKTRDELLGELSDELIDRLLADFGEIDVARLGTRLETLGTAQQERLRQARKQK